MTPGQRGQLIPVLHVPGMRLRIEESVARKYPSRQGAGLNWPGLSRQ